MALKAVGQCLFNIAHEVKQPKGQKQTEGGSGEGANAVGECLLQEGLKQAKMLQAVRTSSKGLLRKHKRPNKLEIEKETVVCPVKLKLMEKVGDTVPQWRTAVAAERWVFGMMGGTVFSSVSHATGLELCFFLHTYLLRSRPAGDQWSNPSPATVMRTL